MVPRIPKPYLPSDIFLGLEQVSVPSQQFISPAPLMVRCGQCGQLLEVQLPPAGSGRPTSSGKNAALGRAAAPQAPLQETAVWGSHEQPSHDSQAASGSAAGSGQVAGRGAGVAVDGGGIPMDARGGSGGSDLFFGEVSLSDLLAASIEMPPGGEDTAGRTEAGRTDHGARGVNGGPDGSSDAPRQGAQPSGDNDDIMGEVRSEGTSEVMYCGRNHDILCTVMYFCDFSIVTE